MRAEFPRAKRPQPEAAEAAQLNAEIDARRTRSDDQSARLYERSRRPEACIHAASKKLEQRRREQGRQGEDGARLHKS